MLAFLVCCSLFLLTHSLPLRVPVGTSTIPVGDNMTVHVRARDVNCDDPDQRNRRNVEICVVDPKACFNCIPKRSCGSMCVDQHVSCGHACPEKPTNQVEYHPVEVTHQTVVEHHEEGEHSNGDSYGHDGDSYTHMDGDSVGHPIGDSFGPVADTYGHGGDAVGHAVGDTYGHGTDVVGHAVGDTYEHAGDVVGHAVGDSYGPHDGDSVGHPIGDSYDHDAAPYDQLSVHDGTHAPLHHEDLSSEYEATHYGGGHHEATYEHTAALHGDTLLHSVDTAFDHHLAPHVDTVHPQDQNLPLTSHEVVAQNLGVHQVTPVSHEVAPAPSNVVIAHNAGTVLASHGSMLTHDGVHAGIIMPPHGSVASSPNCPCNCPVSPGLVDGLPKVIGIENVQYSYNTGRHYCGGECTSVDHNTPATCSHECCP